jgi:hypothetical protein
MFVEDLFETIDQTYVNQRGGGFYSISVNTQTYRFRPNIHLAREVFHNHTGIRFRQLKKNIEGYKVGDLFFEPASDEKCIKFSGAGTRDICVQNKAAMQIIKDLIKTDRTSYALIVCKDPVEINGIKMYQIITKPID